MSNPQPRDAFRSPRFAQPSTFMRLPYRTELSGVDVAIVGVPFDGGHLLPAGHAARRRAKSATSRR